MNAWGKYVVSAALVALIPLSIGCDEKRLKAENQQLSAANLDWQNRFNAQKDENERLKGENENLLGQLAGRDRTIADLQTRLTAAPPPPAPPVVPSTAPPTAPPSESGDTGFPADMDVTRSAGLVTVTLASDLLFDSGKASLKISAKAALDRVADVIKSKYGGNRIRVVGHTDSDPIKKSGWKDNWDLSFNRARAVALHLMEQGVSSKNIEMVGMGDTSPRVSPEKSPLDKAKNRRVGIQVVLPRGG